MPEPAAWVFPILLGSIYAIYRIGRGTTRSSVLEWARLCVLAGLLGAVVAVQVRLAMMGLVQSPVTLGAGMLGVAAVTALVGLNLVSLLETRSLLWTRGHTGPAQG